MSNNVTYLYALVIMMMTTHFVGDFVLQSHWMATNKSKNNIALILHVVVYTSVISIIPVIFVITDAIRMRHAFYFLLFNAIAHFCTDYITSRITSILWCKQQWHNFFLIVGLDQLIHNVCLIMSLAVLVEKVR